MALLPDNRDSGTAEALLQVRDVDVSYHHERGYPTYAVQGASFDVRPGEAVAVTGESGSGKTTTALAVLRLLPAGAKLRGSIRFQGRELTSLGEAELAQLRGDRIAYISQDVSAALNPVLRAGIQVAQVWQAHRRGTLKAAMARAAAIFELAGLEDPQLLRAFPHELSGGQAQRVLLARALVCEPALIVADEPTSALDAITQEEILSLLLDLKKQLQIGMLFITHSLFAVARLATRLLVMYRGRIVEAGPFEEICNTPRHPYTRKLLEHARPRVEGKRELETVSAAGDHVEEDEPWPGCVFARFCPERRGICSSSSPVTIKLDHSTEVRCFLYGR